MTMPQHFYRFRQSSYLLSFPNLDSFTQQAIGCTVDWQIMLQESNVTSHKVEHGSLYIRWLPEELSGHTGAMSTLTIRWLLMKSDGLIWNQTSKTTPNVHIHSSQFDIQNRVSQKYIPPPGLKYLKLKCLLVNHFNSLILKPCVPRVHPSTRAKIPQVKMPPDESLQFINLETMCELWWNCFSQGHS